MRASRQLIAAAALACVLGAALLTTPAGAGNPRVFFATQAKRPIPDAPNGGGVLAKLNVRRSGRIGDMEVGLRINHSFDADLNIYLVSPKGKFVELSTDNGGSGDNYGRGSNSCRVPANALTIFDDEAGRSIRSGSAPFAGSFRPQTPLRSLDGDPIRGTWRLMVFDDDAGSTGTVGCFALGVILR
jgi:subtilisin-like proprotein convertase family protein